MTIEKMLIAEMEGRFSSAWYRNEHHVWSEIELSEKLISLSNSKSLLSELEKEIVELTKRRLALLRVVAENISIETNKKILSGLEKSFQL